MIQIKVPQKKLEEGLIATRRQQHRSDVWVMGVSDNHVQGVRGLLYHDRLGSTNATDISRIKSRFALILVETTNELNNQVRHSFLRDVRDMPVEGGLLFVIGRDNMQVFYSLKSGEDADDAVILSVPGPNMERLLLVPLDGKETSGKHKRSTLKPEERGKRSTDIDKQNPKREYDRLAGAIGLGEIDLGFKLLERASELVVVVVGAGRAGSWLAFRLAQAGVGSRGMLVLIDPDTTASSNLDGMIVAREAVGLPKVLGVRGTIKAITGHTRLGCINASLSDQEAINIVRTADWVFTATDQRAPRLAMAILAARYHVLHIDVAGGLAWTQQRRTVTGGELRSFIPGSQGCLGCYDRYDWQQALQLLGLSSEAERERRQHLNWHQQRPGSNVDVLLPLIGEAMQCFWGILRGERRTSCWWHYEKDHWGRPIWHDWSDRRRRSKRRECRICGEMAGLGDIIE